MKFSSPFCTGIWPFLLMPSILLQLVLFFKWHSIEESIAQNAMSALAEKHPWAKVESFNRGGEILLTGVASSEQQVAEAQQAASAAAGVRKVEFSGRVVPPTPSESELSVIFNNDKIELEGGLNNEAEVRDIVTAAEKTFPKLRIVNRIKTGPRTGTSSHWSSLIMNAESLGAGSSISIIGDALTLKGEVRSVQHRNFLEKRLRSVFPGTIDNQIAIIRPKMSCQAAITKALSEKQINFAIAEVQINPESDALIERLFNAAKLCPYKNFEVSGHTDTSGSLEKNMALSKKRAQTLVDRLVSLGLKRSRFVAKGFGPNKPIADNSSAAGRAANRRIEFKVTN